jgi:2-alkenal reductase
MAAALLLLAALAALSACAGQPVIAPTPIGAQPSAPVAEVRAALSDSTLRGAAFQLPTPVPADLIAAANAEYVVLQNLYARTVPSVVNIEAVYTVGSGQSEAGGSGSGFVYGRIEGEDAGYIVTNAHVVSGAARIRVTFHEGIVEEADLIALDVYSDIAVLRVETRAERLIPLPFADSDSVVVGQRAIAIGNPFGLASSMTIGIISALGRQLPSAELISNTVGGFNNPSILQVDADINPGNSGGPLLNTAGQVIGVNTAIRTVSGVFEGVGFAVPANTVRRVVPDLIERGEVAYAWVGISSLSAENGYGVAGLAEVLGLPVEAGVLIDSVTPGSPAASAGLLGGTRPVVVRGREVCAGGDIIVAVDGRYVRTMDELVAYLVVNSEPGESIELLIVRGEDTFEVPVRLEARPSDDALQAPPPCGE